jgi:hypothetical protein
MDGLALQEIIINVKMGAESDDSETVIADISYNYTGIHSTNLLYNMNERAISSV